MRVVFTNGCFDCFHHGHMNLLSRCAELCADHGVLIVALNSDESVRRLKGPDRPRNPWMTRAAHVATYCTLQLGVSPQVIPFHGDPFPLLEAIMPDYLVKGSDWTRSSTIGAELVIYNGGELVLVPRVPDVSTTQILALDRTSTKE